jgi:hypothetical protein
MSPDHRERTSPSWWDKKSPGFHVSQFGSRVVATTYRPGRRYRSRWSASDDKGENEPVKGKRLDVKYEYFDGGNHFCLCCNFLSSNVFEYCQHLSSSAHQQNVDPFDKPWLKAEEVKNEKQSNTSKANVISTRIKGVEFLMSVQAFYCRLCSEYMGSSASAETHFKSETHNQKYGKYLDENTFYERRLELEKSTALATASKWQSSSKTPDAAEVSSSVVTKDNLSAIVEAAKSRVKRLVQKGSTSDDDEPALLPKRKKSKVDKKTSAGVTDSIRPRSTDVEGGGKSGSADVDSKKTDSHSKTGSAAVDVRRTSEEIKPSQADVPVTQTKKSLPFIGKLPKFKKLTRPTLPLSTEQSSVADDKNRIESTCTAKAGEVPDISSIVDVIDMEVDGDAVNTASSLDTFLTIGDPSTGSTHTVPVIDMQQVGPPTWSTYVLLHQQTPDTGAVPTVTSQCSATVSSGMCTTVSSDNVIAPLANTSVAGCTVRCTTVPAVSDSSDCADQGTSSSTCAPVDTSVVMAVHNVFSDSPLSAVTLTVPLTEHTGPSNEQSYVASVSPASAAVVQLVQNSSAVDSGFDNCPLPTVIASLPSVEVVGPVSSTVILSGQQLSVSCAQSTTGSALQPVLNSCAVDSGFSHCPLPTVTDILPSVTVVRSKTSTVLPTDKQLCATGVQLTADMTMQSKQISDIAMDGVDCGDHNVSAVESDSLHSKGVTVAAASSQCAGLQAVCDRLASSESGEVAPSVTVVQCTDVRVDDQQPSVEEPEQMYILTADDNTKDDYEPKCDNEQGNLVARTDDTTAILLPHTSAMLNAQETSGSCDVPLAFSDDFEILDECNAEDGSV